MKAISMHGSLKVQRQENSYVIEIKLINSAGRLFWIPGSICRNKSN